MDVAQEIEGTFKVPSILLAFLAVITGILILFFPYILNVLIAFFLIVWGLLRAAELGSKPSPESKTTETSGSITTGQTTHGLDDEYTASSFDDPDSN